MEQCKLLYAASECVLLQYVENSLALFSMFEETQIQCPSNSILGIYPKETLAHLQHEIYVRILIEAAIVITPNWKQQLVGKLGPYHRRQGETKGRGRPLLIGRW